MSYRLRFTRSARRDVGQAARWYDGERVGLGRAFVADLDLVVDRLVEAPAQFPVIEGDVRRALFSRFPYAAYFALEGLSVLVLAVVHTHRDPNAWRRSGAVQEGSEGSRTSATSERLGLFRIDGGRSDGRPIRRDDAYEDRV